MERSWSNTPFGRLDTDTPDQYAEPGTLRAVSNLVRQGVRGRAFWGPAEPAEDLGDLGFTPLSIYRYDAGGQQYTLCLTSSTLVLVEMSLLAQTIIYTFGTNDPTRRAQFAKIGDLVYIAVVSGSGIGSPETLLVYDGADAYRFHVPQLPYIQFATATVTTTGLSSEKIYGVRYAYLFKDGTIGPPGQPCFLETSSSAGPFKVTFSTGFFPDDGNEVESGDYYNVITGIAVFMTPPLPNDTEVDGLFSSPYYRVASLPRPTTGGSVAFQGTDADIIQGEALVDADANLLQHDVTAGACFGYNARLILGDVCYDFRAPNVAIAASTPSLGVENAGTDYKIYVGATIRTGSGDYQRISDPLYVGASGAAAFDFRGVREPSGGTTTHSFIAYPDSRAVQFQVYVDKRDGAGAKLLDTFEAARATAGNISYAETGTLDLTGATSTAMPDPDALRVVKDCDGNRLLASSTFTPFEMLARRARYIGNATEDHVLTFAAQTLPISEGQFGQYPLLVFLGNSIWGLQVGEDDVAFTSLEPLDITKGAIGRFAVANCDGRIVFASPDGVWSVTRGVDDTPLSTPVQSELLPQLTSATHLAYFTDESRGRREVWLGAGAKIYAFSLEHMEWTTLARVRACFARFAGLLHAAGTDGHLYTEFGGSGTTTFSMALARQHIAGVGLLKRLFRFGLRTFGAFTELHVTMTDSETGTAILDQDIVTGGPETPGRHPLRLQSGLLTDVEMEITGEAEADVRLEGFDLEYMVRFGHRERVY